MATNRIVSQESYWNRVASNYNSRYGYNTEQGKVKLIHKVDRMVSMLGLKAGDSVLELGCGTGMYSHLLSQNGFRVTGVDISEKMLEAARKQSRKSDFQRMDIHNLAFADNSFDSIVGFYILQYCDVFRVLQESYRVLKKNGTIGFIEPNMFNPIVFGLTKVDLVKKVKHISPEADSFSGHELTKLMSQQFKEVSIRYVEYGGLNFMADLAVLKKIAGSIIVKGEK